MKKFTLSFKLLTLLFCSFLIVSCADDDEEQSPSLENQLEYFDTIYDLTFGAMLELGPAGFVSTDTHYGQAFLVSDADPTGVRVNLIFETYSLGTSGFKTGRFEYANLRGFTPAQQEAAFGERNFFINSALFVDLNDDEELDNNEAVTITSGTVNISGTAPNYTLDCDVVLENGKRVRAQFAGNFEDVTDDIIDEDDVKTNMRKALGGIPSALRAPESFKAR